MPRQPVPFTMALTPRFPRAGGSPAPRALLACLLGLNGCGTVTTHNKAGQEITMTQEEFSQYVEHVFRYHNQVMSEVMEAESEGEPADRMESRKLAEAQKTMLKVCEPLNEVVSETLSGENVGIQLKLDLIDAVPACEAASENVHDLIP